MLRQCRKNTFIPQLSRCFSGALKKGIEPETIGSPRRFLKTGVFVVGMILTGVAPLGGATEVTPTCGPAMAEATIYVANGKIAGGPHDGKPYQGHLTGTDGPDVIVGTNGKDQIDSLQGDDIVCGLGGDDRVFAGLGDDWVSGDEGNDHLNGGPDSDLLFGGPGDDRLNGGQGRMGKDQARGGPGKDGCLNIESYIGSHDGDDCGQDGGQGLTYHGDWPVIESLIAQDPEIESAVGAILSQMTLEEKIGQMIQPNLDQVTPEEAGNYKLGTLLNGGGSWPNGVKHSTAADWVEKADAYWQALENAYADRGFRIPFMWATDAVHGHNNVYGATVFPHNIGLGAANDPDLIYRIGEITAREVAATGLDWTFAPTVAAPRDLRWGRTYEGYSEDPEIIHAYAGEVVAGLQGTAETLKSDTKVISTVKHWVGDGGTEDGVDRGVNRYSEEYLINLHATGYFSGLSAGAQVVMSSFNSWDNDANYDLGGEGDYNGKIHGSKYLITDVLKGKMGFDGVVITDWNGHTEIDGCSASNCVQAVLAGNDLFMIPSRVDWTAFYDNLIAQVEDGTVPMSRIDDAVTRILRVKMRAGMWDKPRPSERSVAGNQSVIGAAGHREVAREAVRKSLVLMKNKSAILPLSSDARVYLAGSAIDNLQKQTGGWTLTWQGTENTADDLPGATTIRQAIQGAGVTVVDSLTEADEETIAIVAIGEDPYAEFFGDIKAHQTLGYARLKSTYRADLELIRDLHSRGMKVVTIFLSGRPMYVNEEINLSDAFVAAWLPGTEATGIADVLFARNGENFTGRLPYTWPYTQCGAALNRVAPNIPTYVTPETEQDLDGEHAPLFHYGYGLSYGDESSASLDSLELDLRDYGCGQDEPDTGVATIPLEIYNRNSGGEFILRISGAANGWSGIPVSNQTVTEQGDVTTTPINYQGQYDAVHVKFDGDNLAQIYLQYEDEQGQDQNSYLNADSTLQFDIRVQQSPTGLFNLAQHCVHPCLGEVKFKDAMPAPSDSWTTMKVPLTCFAEQGMNYSLLNTPFLFFTGGEAEFDLGNIRIVPRSIDPATDALTCEELAGQDKPPLNDAISHILSDEVWSANYSTWTARTGSDWSPVPELITHTVTGTGIDTEIRVVYESEGDPNDKGVFIVNGTLQNLSNYSVSGELQFDLFVESYGSNTQGLVVKMESSDTGPDIFIGGPDVWPAGQWHTVRIPFATLGLNDAQIKEVIKPFVVLPSFGEVQRGTSFRFRNVQLVMAP